MTPVIIGIGLIAVGMIIGGLWFPSRQRCTACQRWTRITFSFCPYCGQACSEPEQEQPIEDRQEQLQGAARPRQRLRPSRKSIIVSEDETVKPPRLILSSGESKAGALIRSLCLVCWRKVNEDDHFCGHCGSKMRRANRQ